MTSRRPAAFALLFLMAVLALGSSDVAFCDGERESVESHQGADVAESLEEVKHEDGMEDDEYGSGGSMINRPEDERPRTTKRLYTTRRSVRGDAKSRGLLSAKLKLFGLGTLFTFIVIYLGILGKSLLSEDQDDDDDKRNSESKRDS